MEDICEICGVEFSASLPRCHVENHIICKSCKMRIENKYSSFKDGFEKEKEKLEGQFLQNQREFEERKKEKEENSEYLNYTRALNLRSFKYSFENYKATKANIEYVLEDAKNKGYNFSIKQIFFFYCIAMDLDKQKILIKYKDTTDYKIYDYSDILDFNLEEDGSESVEGRSGSALVGGLLFGAVGAIAGASREKNVTEICRKLILSITINDPLNYRVEINFINGNYVEKDSVQYSNGLSAAKEMVAILQLATKGEKTQAENENAVLPDVNDSIEAIKKYKELLDIGAITQEEFDTKKKQLLGI